MTDKNLSGDFDPVKMLKAVVEAATGNGLFSPETVDFPGDRGAARLVAVACAPRSGSTFLANTLSKLSGFPYFRLSSGYATNEHDLYLPALCLMNRMGAVSQLHMKGTWHNANLIRLFDIKTIILVRDIFDTVVSLHGDLRKKEQHEGYGTGISGYSFLWQDQATRNLNDEALFDLIIDLALPWYVNFFVSWHRLCQAGQVRAHWVTYEAMMADKEQVLGDLMRFIGTPAKKDVGRLVSRKYNTFQVGGTGRGRKTLSDRQKEAVRRLFRYYPDVDFSPLGL